ncbi:hypothetical protein IVB22_27015 [Bradyrhizobium sp. 190]|uniref:hypothetical protein n=1 Tax=Bradyrhizobium sp. 190 TaxID=2782658 RepID=UPI001FF8025C|nr:hypothetical protein [Bradyrhizobium sp. 190]MCK1516127.1 hypothetical protein [Bradyrhizobium sp. 190]
MTKRLMFPSSIAFAKKISKLHWCEVAAEWLVGSMKNKQAVVVAAEKPSVCALVNLSFSDCHAGPVPVDMEAGSGGNVCPIVNRTRKMLS